MPSVGEAFLELLKRRGVEYLYANAGTDFAPLVEAYARASAGAKAYPEPVACGHENLAVGMAHGYYAATGRMQCVMVHVNVGTANALCALINAAKDNTPILLVAGRNPIFEQCVPGARSLYIHWAQEMYDQAGMVREFVKWDYELRSPLQVQEVLDRALSIAQAPPRGPVYLTLPREVLTASAPELPSSLSALMPVSAPAPDQYAMDKAAAAIAAAELPVLIVNDVGRDVRTAAQLASLAEMHAIGVVEANKALFSNLASSHSMHLGCDVGPVLSEADCVIVLSTDVPWIPLYDRPRAGVRLIHVAEDPLFTGYPMRGFSGELAIMASTPAFLAALDEALCGSVAVSRVEARRERIGHLRAAVRAKGEARIVQASQASKITKAWLNACLARTKPHDAIVVNEYWVDRTIMRFDAPGCYFSHSTAGGLGWGLPAALGIQQALPDRLVIAALGDGAYIFANPAACHHVAEKQGLPVLTVICNNARWEAVDRAAAQVYPDSGHNASASGPLASLEPIPRFETYVQASGGWGQHVNDPAELPRTLETAIAVVSRERRQAVLNVICV